MSKLLQRLVWVLITLSALAVSFSSSARAVLLFSDSFAYPAGGLTGQGPPSGAPPGQSGWTAVSGNPKVMSDGLEFANVFSTGGATIFHGFVPYQDAASASLTTIRSGVVWIGFMINNGNNDHSGYADLRLGGISDSVIFGLIGDLYTFGIENVSPLHIRLTPFYPGTQVSWLVLKLDFDRGKELLFVNPTSDPTRNTPDATLRMNTDFHSDGFNQVTLEVGMDNDIWHFDELRIGTTFRDLLNGQ